MHTQEATIDEAERLHKKSLAIKREIGDRQGEAGSLNGLGAIARIEVTSLKLFQKKSGYLQKLVQTRRGKSLGNLGLIADTRGDLAEAERFWKVWLSEREIGNRQGEADSQGNLGLIAIKEISKKSGYRKIV